MAWTVSSSRTPAAGIRLCSSHPPPRPFAKAAAGRLQEDRGMTKITVLAGGIGGARFTRGLLHYLEANDASAQVTVIVTVVEELPGVRV